MTKKTKPVVTSVHIVGTDIGRFGVACEFDGARYHVWLDPQTCEPAKSNIMYKNPAPGLKRGEPDYFDARKLALDGPSAQKVYPAMRAAIADGTLIQKWRDAMSDGDAVLQRAADAEMAEHRIKRAGPKLLAALETIRAGRIADALHHRLTDTDMARIAHEALTAAGVGAKLSPADIATITGRPA